MAKKAVAGKVSIGFLEGQTYPDGTPVAAVAFWNEFGHSGRFPSPPRSFFRSLIAKEGKDWNKEMAKQFKLTDYNTDLTLNRMGEWIKGQLQESITKITEPALSHTTLVLRHRFWSHPEDIRFKDVLSALSAPESEEASETQAKPLVWTKFMIRHVDFEVKLGGR